MVQLYKNAYPTNINEPTVWNVISKKAAQFINVVASELQGMTVVQVRDLASYKTSFNQPFTT